ncbi:MAG: sugar transferase [Blastopirellula sp.]|nr:MAG: sugar transferase [Blastopirellula sp.]
MKKLIIFDCDGVLVDSEKIGNQVLVDMVRPLGVPLSHVEACHRFKGCKLADIIQELEESSGHTFPEDFVPNFRREMHAAFERDILPIDGIAEALANICLPKCVASGGPPEKIQQTLSITGLLHYFGENIFSSYVVKSWKPEPGLFLHAANAMGYEPSECLVIEDSVVGVKAAVAAGMKVLGYSESSGQELQQLGATVFHDMKLLPEMVKKHC